MRDAKSRSLFSLAISNFKVTEKAIGRGDLAKFLKYSLSKKNKAFVKKFDLGCSIDYPFIESCGILRRLRHAKQLTSCSLMVQNYQENLTRKLFKSLREVYCARKLQILHWDFSTLAQQLPERECQLLIKRLRYLKGLKKFSIKLALTQDQSDFRILINMLLTLNSLEGLSIGLWVGFLSASENLTVDENLFIEIIRAIARFQDLQSLGFEIISSYLKGDFETYKNPAWSKKSLKEP